MLTYAPSASGPVAPAHGWNFSSPVINYAGPSGLALDAAGNFYLSGALKAALGQSYGVFVASSADVGNPSADVARTLPWDRTTELTPGLANDVALDSSGEIFVSNILLAGSGSATSCQGRANVFAGGPGGGVTDTPPLRVLLLQGVFTADPTCSSSRNPLQPFFRRSSSTERRCSSPTTSTTPLAPLQRAAAASCSLRLALPVRQRSSTLRSLSRSHRFPVRPRPSRLPALARRLESAPTLTYTELCKAR